MKVTAATGFSKSWYAKLNIDGNNVSQTYGYSGSVNGVALIEVTGTVRSIGPLGTIMWDAINSLFPGFTNYEQVIVGSTSISVDTESGIILTPTAVVDLTSASMTVELQTFTVEVY